MLSDRLGRVRVLRLALFGAAVAGVLSAAAPNLTVLIAARSLTGGLLAAVIPTSIVYIGDALPMNLRHKAIADLMAATAVGTALAILFGGLAANLDAWRLAFATPALASVALGLLLNRLPEPKCFDTETRDSPLVQVRRVLGQRWAVVVVGIALLEGGVILGFITFLAPALEGAGFSPAVAGFAVGFFGLAVFGGTQAAKLVADRLGASALMLVGGVMLALGCTCAAVEQSLVSVGAAAVLAGGGFAFMHPPLLSWATEVVPESRATVISLSAAALFAGSGIATMTLAPLAQAGSFGLLFTLTAVVAVPLGLFASLSRLRYSRPG
jgi:predicted MFS family arabinose efflux permease